MCEFLLLPAEVDAITRISDLTRWRLEKPAAFPDASRSPIAKSRGERLARRPHESLPYPICDDRLIMVM